MHEGGHIPTYSGFYTGQNKTHFPYSFPTLITGVNIAHIRSYFQSDYGCKYFAYSRHIHIRNTALSIFYLQINAWYTRQNAILVLCMVSRFIHPIHAGGIDFKFSTYTGNRMKLYSIYKFLIEIIN